MKPNKLAKTLASRRFVQPGDEYRRGPRGNLIRTDLRGKMRGSRRRGDISSRQQRKALKINRRLSLLLT